MCQTAPWLFKLHVREGGHVVGGAFFAHYTTVTPRLAWDTFGTSNGAMTFEAFIGRLARHSEHAFDPDVTEIGASVLVQPFFLPEEQWIAAPRDWASNLIRGKTYDTETGEGGLLWDAVLAATARRRPDVAVAASDVPSPAYGTPVLVAPRLGQGAFRIMVTDAYDRRCLVTGARTIPVLSAAHIKPYNLVQRHEVSNGILLRSDLHTLFDRGYLTINPADRRLLVSKRIHEEFENGRDYYALHGKPVRVPQNPAYQPSPEMLAWHAQTVFRG